MSREREREREREGEGEIERKRGREREYFRLGRPYVTAQNGDTEWGE